MYEYGMKSLFKDNAKSYLLLVILGILAGFSVVFFCELPDNSLWAFYYWSSNTFGFWMFSASLIVLFSEKRKCAAINAGIYIFLMFLITTAYKSFRLYWDGNTPFHSLLDLSVNSIYGWLLYSIPNALLSPHASRPWMITLPADCTMVWKFRQTKTNIATMSTKMENRSISKSPTRASTQQKWNCLIWFRSILKRANLCEEGSQ